jgi:hypothetical protein
MKTEICYNNVNNTEKNITNQTTYTKHKSLEQPRCRLNYLMDDLNLIQSNCHTDNFAILLKFWKMVTQVTSQ